MSKRRTIAGDTSKYEDDPESKFGIQDSIFF